MHLAVCIYWTHDSEVQSDCNRFFTSFVRSHQVIYIFTLFEDFCTETPEYGLLLVETCVIYINNERLGLTEILLYRVIRNDCRGFNNLSYTLHLR
jgi:hypothetical protein